MKRIADAEPRDLDTWNIGITAGDRRLLATQLPLTILYSWTKCACITGFPYFVRLYHLQTLVMSVRAHEVHLLLAVSLLDGKGKTKTLPRVNLPSSYVTVLMAFVIGLMAETLICTLGARAMCASTSTGYESCCIWSWLVSVMQ